MPSLPDTAAGQSKKAPPAETVLSGHRAVPDSACRFPCKSSHPIGHAALGAARQRKTTAPAPRQPPIAGTAAARPGEAIPAAHGPPEPSCGRKSGAAEQTPLPTVPGLLSAAPPVPPLPRHTIPRSPADDSIHENRYTIPPAPLSVLRHKRHSIRPETCPPHTSPSPQNNCPPVQPYAQAGSLIPFSYETV